jgi:hypothetical protein
MLLEHLRRKDWAYLPHLAGEGRGVAHIGWWDTHGGRTEF